MIEMLTGGILLAVGVMLGTLTYHFAFRFGAETVWRASDETRPALFEKDSGELPLETTEEMDAEALEDQDLK